MSLFEPDRLFARITAIDIRRDLLDAGICAVLLDIDNTLRSRETGDVPHDVGVWLGKARDAGIAFCLLSNNWHADVRSFAESLDLPIVAKAMKPLPFSYLMAIHKLNVEMRARDRSEEEAAHPSMHIGRRQTVSIGDQVFTDVAGAHLAGIRAYMVAPLAEVDLKHTLLLRNIEKRLIGSREPEPSPAVIFEGAPIATNTVDEIHLHGD